MADIQDFGEKIGGAKKDLWKRRGLQIEELADMNERDLLENVTKENVWGEVDYIALVEGGMTRENALYIKMIRDSLPAKIDKYRNYTLQQIAEKYITFINEVKEECYKTLVMSDILTLERRILVSHGYLEGREWTDKSKGVFPLSEKKFMNLICVSKSKYMQVMQEALIQNFPYEYRNELKNTYICAYGSYGFTIAVKGKGLLFKGSKENGKFFKTQDECIEYCRNQIRADIDAIRAEKKASKQGDKLDKKKLMPPYLEHIKRDGVDYRNGRDIDTEELLKVFEFRGGEFGNWVNQNERQEYINRAYDSFLDLAKVLNLPIKAMSLGGYENMKLAIAFGARGSGNALAHYERARVVINLTKLRGAGSLAHEMGHALDDFIGNKVGYGTFLSTYPGYSRKPIKPELMPIIEAMEKVMRVIKETQKTKEEYLQEIQKRIKSNQANLNRYVENILKQFNTQYYVKGKGAGYRDVTSLQIEEMTTLANNVRERHTDLDSFVAYYKAVRGKGIDKETVKFLSMMIQIIIGAQQEIKVYEETGELNTGKKRTDFYRNALELDVSHGSRSKAYWSLSEELFARAFAAYVEDNLGFRNDYLVYGTNYVPPAPFPRTNPSGEERKAINEAMKELMESIRVGLFEGIGFAMRRPAHLRKPLREEDKARMAELAEKSKALEEERERVEQERAEQEKAKVTEEKKKDDKTVQKPVKRKVSTKSIESAKDLRNYLKDKQTYNGSLEKAFVHFVNSSHKKGMDIMVEKTPKNKLIGSSRVWCIKANKIVIDSTQTTEKKLEGVLESVTTVLMKKKGILAEYPTIEECVRQIVVYKLCKKFNLDVRTYCMGIEFDRLVQSSELDKCLEVASSVLKDVLVQIGLA